VIILLTIAEKEERGRNIAHCDIRSKRYSKRRRIKKKDKLVFENGVELFRYMNIFRSECLLKFRKHSKYKICEGRRGAALLPIVEKWKSQTI
jgi:hypothetical protein